jgi:hypothetical protein
MLELRVQELGKTLELLMESIERLVHAVSRKSPEGEGFWTWRRRRGQ